MRYGKIYQPVVAVRPARVSRRPSAVTVEALERRVLLAANVAASALAPNRAGSLDPTFGNSGVVMTTFPGQRNDDVLQAMATQPDGKILATGYAYQGTTPYTYFGNFPLVRYNLDGSLDSSFGQGGIVYLPEPSGGRGLAVQDDGSILVAVAGPQFPPSDFILFRTTSTGALDQSFGNGGKVTTDLGGAAQSVAVEPDGRIVLGGSSNGHAALVRYMRDGTLDPTFGTDGVKIISSGLGDGAFQAMAIQPDGKIDLVTQQDNLPAYTTGYLLRLNSDGSSDSTFGTGGLVDVGFSTDAVAVLRDGDVVVGGTIVTASANGLGNHTSKAALQFYQPNGQPDAAVGTAGQIRTSFGMQLSGYDSYDTITAITQQRDDKMVVAANVDRSRGFADNHQLWGVARFTTTGQLDPTFGTGGISLSQEISDEFAENDVVGLGIEPDGGIVVAGSPGRGGLGVDIFDFNLERYLSDPLASISGTIYNDANGSGVWQPADTGIPGRTVYLDQNNNGHFDAGEPSAVTDANGHYSIANLPAGLDYIVRQIVPSGWRQTAPVNGFGIHVNLVPGQYAMITGFEDAARSPFSGVAPYITDGPIEAENFDVGGEGIAYHDTTPQNINGQYRPNEGVDINKGGSNGYSVGYTAPGEWLDYSIYSTNGAYIFQATVANSGRGGTFHMELDGVDMTGEMTVPNTGPWDTWITISSNSFTLTNGPHIMRIQMDQPGVWGNIGDFDKFAFVKAAILPETPYLGNPFNVNVDTLYADEFDSGGEGVAYHVVAPAAHYNLLREEDNVTLNPGGANGYVVGYTAPGEWLNYTILAPTAGTYKLEANVANYQQGGTFHMNIDGANATGAMTVPNSGPWDTWATISSQSFTLSAGRHVMRIQMDTPGYWGNIGDFNWFKFVPA